MDQGGWPLLWMLFTMVAFFGLALVFFLAMAYFLPRLTLRFWLGRPPGGWEASPEDGGGWRPGSAPDLWDLLVRLEALERRVRELERHHSWEKGLSGE